MIQVEVDSKHVEYFAVGQSDAHYDIAAHA